MEHIQVPDTVMSLSFSKLAGINMAMMRSLLSIVVFHKTKRKRIVMLQTPGDA